MPHYMANGAKAVAAVTVATLVTVPLVTLSIGIYLWDRARESMAPKPLSDREYAAVVASIAAISEAKKQKGLI